MTAYTSTLSGPPVRGKYIQDDTITDALGVLYRCVRSGSPGQWVSVADKGVSPSEAAVLDGVTPGTGLASKAVVLDSAGSTTIPGYLKPSTAVVAAAGADQPGATLLANEVNVVTGANNSTGVRLPVMAAKQTIRVINTAATYILKVYPATGGSINGVAPNTAFSLGPAQSAEFTCTAADTIYAPGFAATNMPVANLAVFVQGVSGGYKIARGQHTQVAAADTVVTGLSSVAAVAVSFDSAPTVKQLFVSGAIGDQAGAPAAGSVIISTFKPTAVNDVTPAAATDFTENLVIGWVAVGL